jgi:pimeloyl-ACP methyl ester carboxylesterase
VRNRWGGMNGTLQQYLVQQGFIVVQVDVRGSVGYGRPFREAFLMDYGGRDLDDLKAVADGLGALPYVDKARMGIFGSSYGGLLSAYALLKRPGMFAWRRRRRSTRMPSGPTTSRLHEHPTRIQRRSCATRRWNSAPTCRITCSSSTG